MSSAQSLNLQEHPGDDVYIGLLIVVIYSTTYHVLGPSQHPKRIVTASRSSKFKNRDLRGQKKENNNKQCMYKPAVTSDQSVKGA